MFRFSTPVFPSEDDHVVTAPYNALLAASQLVADADCVLPVENQALADICARSDRSSGGTVTSGGPAAPPGRDTQQSTAAHATRSDKPWDAMNGVAASMLLNLTAGMRFPGSLNVDMNDLSSNLVPFPRMHFLLAGVAPPLTGSRDVGRLSTPRSLDQVR